MTDTGQQNVSSPRVLIVDDALADRDVIARALRAGGMLCAEAYSLREASAAIISSQPDLVILDLRMPDGHGLASIPSISAAGAPVIVCSADPRESIRVACLEAGAADYIVKPFSPRELAIRAARIVGERAPNRDVQFRAGELALDPETRTASLFGREVKLSPKEYALLAELVRRRGRVTSRDELLAAAWRGDHKPGVATVVEHIRRLRLRIETDPSRPKIICSVRGRGYVLNAPQVS